MSRVDSIIELPKGGDEKNAVIAEFKELRTLVTEVFKKNDKMMSAFAVLDGLLYNAEPHKASSFADAAMAETKGAVRIMVEGGDLVADIFRKYDLS